VLALQRGFIQGTIPSTLGNLKSLKNLDLNFNNITGSIPENLYNAKTLEQVDLNDNELTGAVSSKIGDLKNLFYWQLGNDSPWGKNSFKGNLPSSISGLNKLRKCLCHFISDMNIFFFKKFFRSPIFSHVKIFRSSSIKQCRL
jgi:hypothetical protein